MAAAGTGYVNALRSRLRSQRAVHDGARGVGVINDSPRYTRCPITGRRAAISNPLPYYAVSARCLSSFRSETIARPEEGGNG